MLNLDAREARPRTGRARRISLPVTRISALLLSLAAVAASPAQNVTPPPPVDLASLEFVELVDGLRRATSIAHAGDGSGRLFVTEQGGRILVHDGRALLATPFLDLSGRTVAAGERGLLSIAFHPDYVANGHFFVNYTDLNGNTVVSRFNVSADPNVADPASETVFFTAAQPRRNHNGGQIQFGPDGYLYIGMGDGGGAGDPPNLAQDLGSVMGKMLRVEVDLGPPARAPASNPFLATPGVLPEIWAYGLRNPWRFSFDRLTGDMFIGDVGQNAVEEVSIQPAASAGGENYGWRLMEGTACFRPTSGCNDGTLTLPILEYPNYGANCGGSITGGYRYRGAAFPDLTGIYLYADYCTGEFYAGVEVDGAWQQVGPRLTPHQIRTFGEDEGGEIYFATSTTVYRIQSPRPDLSISVGGVVNAATLRIGSGLAPGSLATLFGTGLAESTETATGLPLPYVLGGGSVAFNGSVQAPQTFAGPGQRNFQVPWEMEGLASASLAVTVGEEVSPSVPVPLARVSPGIFALNHSGQAAAFIEPGGAIAGPVGSFGDSRPAVAGETVSVYATGLGPVTNRPATGAGALEEPASTTVLPVTARAGDQSLAVAFSGLATSFAGVYRIDLVLNETSPAGDAVPIAIRVGGVESNTAFIAIATSEPSDPAPAQP